MWLCVCLQDVRTWLEGIVTRSKERAGVHSHLVTDAVPRDPRMIHLPKFVGHRWGRTGRVWGSLPEAVLCEGCGRVLRGLQ